MTPLIIDCDPGQDDAIALLLAFAAPEALDVLGVTAVAGNVPLSLTARNARAICELAGRADVPVHAGCARPLVGAPASAEHVHGASGLDGADLPEPRLPLAPGHAVDFLIETLGKAGQPVTLAVTGPQTNVATALRRAPEIAQNIERIVMMGGAVGPGNITPFAEFNIFADPYAADIVFRSGIPIVMFGLDVTHRVIATDERIAEIRALASPVARAVAGMLGFYGKRKKAAGLAGPPLHDPCTIAWLIEPGLFEGRPMRVRVETERDPRIGRTVCTPSTLEEANALVMLEADADRFFALLTERLARYSRNGLLSAKTPARP